MGDRDRLQHLTACPGELLKVTEREKDTYGGTRRQDRERERHALSQEGDKKKKKKTSQTSWVRKIGTYTVYLERLGWHKWSPDGHTRARARTVHTYTEERSTCTPPPGPPDSRLLSHDAMHFIYSTVFLRGIHLSKLFASHFCHNFLIRSWPACFSILP